MSHSTLSILWGIKESPYPQGIWRLEWDHKKIFVDKPRFIILCFMVLPRNCAVFFCFLFFNKLEVCGNPAQSKSIGTIYSTAFVHFLSLCHILMILTFQTFPLLLQLFWWSVAGDHWCSYWNVLKMLMVVHIFQPLSIFYLKHIHRFFRHILLHT